jgi:histidinol-phosphate aminotransferase
MSKMGKDPQPRPFLEQLAPYIGGRERVEGVENPHKLSANENPLGPSEKAIEALTDLSRLEIYPDGSSKLLREAIGKQFNLDPDRIICGNGSDEIFHLLAQAYLEPGDETICTRHSFLVYRLVTEAAGGHTLMVQENNLTADVDAILAAVTEKTKIVFIANPNNPTGTVIGKSEIRRLHAGLRSDIIFLIDGAYAEYVTDNIYDDAYDLVNESQNVVVTRTFSKAYGLASLRLGWGYFPASIADILNRTRAPFNINALASRAGMAALADQAHIERTVEHNMQWRNWCTQQINALGIEVLPSEANFILLRFQSESMANAADDFLCQKGVILRALSAYGLPECLRMTIGTQVANRDAVEALSAFMETYAQSAKG